MRTDEAVGLIFELLEKLCNSTETEGPSLPRKRKAPRDLDVAQGDAYHSPTMQEHYRRQYFEAIDVVVAKIQVCFDQPGYAIYHSLESLLLKAANQKTIPLSFKKLFPFMEMTSLRVNFPHSCNFGTYFAQESQPDKITLQEVLKFLQSLSVG